jgi:hypothetical protein
MVWKYWPRRSNKIMNNLQIDNPELDAAVWQAWIKKNEVRDRLSFERRRRILTVAVGIAGVIALLWRFA